MVHQYNIPHIDDRIVCLTSDPPHKVLRFARADVSATPLSLCADSIPFDDRASTFSPYKSKLTDYLESTSFKDPEDSARSLFRYDT